MLSVKYHTSKLLFYAVVHIQKKQNQNELMPEPSDEKVQIQRKYFSYLDKLNWKSRCSQSSQNNKEIGLESQLRSQGHSLKNALHPS